MDAPAQDAAPAAPHCYEAPELPDLPLHLIFSHATAAELATLALCDRRFAELAASDVLWRKLSAATLPPTVLAHASAAQPGCPSWRARHLVAQHTRAVWRGGGLRSPRAARASEAVRGPAPASLRVPGASGPIFCINALQRTAGGPPSFLSGGADGVVRVMQVRAGQGSSGGSGGDAAAATFRGWYLERAGPSLAASASLCAAGREGEGGDGGAFPHGARLHEAHSFQAHDGGMLGMSLEDATPAHAPPAAAAAPTLITCAFSGHASLWRVNHRELARLRELPARRLRGLLRARGIPTEGLNEKAEYVALIERFGALPVASRLAELQRHGGTVVSASHTTRGAGGGVAITSSHDGDIKVYSLGEALEREAARLEGGGGGGGGAAAAAVPALTPTRIIPAHPGSGCDCAVLERSGGGGGALAGMLSGGKDGAVRAWDLETGAQTWQAALGDVWVWCLRSAGALEGGLEAGEVAGGEGACAYAHPAVFLSGCTAGIVRLYDRRARACVQAVSVEDGPLHSSYVHGQGGMHLGEGRAIAGLSLCVCAPQLWRLGAHSLDALTPPWPRPPPRPPPTATPPSMASSRRALTAGSPCGTRGGR